LLKQLNHNKPASREDDEGGSTLETGNQLNEAWGRGRKAMQDMKKEP